MKQPVIVSYESMYVKSLPVGAVALDTGDLVSFETNAIVLMDAATEDVTFTGIVGGKCGTTDAGKMLPVYTKCLVEIDCSSATYALGSSVGYVSKNLVGAAAGANTIGWVFGNYTSAVTRILVLIDVANLSDGASAKLFVVPAA